MCYIQRTIVYAKPAVYAGVVMFVALQFNRMFDNAAITRHNCETAWAAKEKALFEKYEKREEVDDSTGYAAFADMLSSLSAKARGDFGENRFRLEYAEYRPCSRHGRKPKLYYTVRPADGEAAGVEKTGIEDPPLEAPRTIVINGNAGWKYGLPVIFGVIFAAFILCAAALGLFSRRDCVFLDRSKNLPDRISDCMDRIAQLLFMYPICAILAFICLLAVSGPLASRLDREFKGVIIRPCRYPDCASAPGAGQIAMPGDGDCMEL